LNLGYLKRSEKITGLSYGVNVNSMFLDKIDFFLWQDEDSGAYRQNEEAITQLAGMRLSIDPMINYYNDNGIQHSLKTRFFYVDNHYEEDSAKNSIAQSAYFEYQLVKRFKNSFNLVSGITEKITGIDAELYGNHSGNEISFYTQLDKEFVGKLKFLFGFRVEQYSLDNVRDKTRPIFRTGINYKLAEYTNLRASLGQGYRYPSVAEKYTSTSVSSVRIFPNPDLKPEEGWSSEIGIMQSLKIKTWFLMIDLAAYYTRYKDMVEFRFGLYAPEGEIPTLEHVGFSSMNVSNTMIKGIDFNIRGKKDIGDLKVKFLMGYTYTNPIDLDFDNDTIEDGEILKYRNLHIAKSDIEASYQKFTAGIYLSYHSKMVNVDSIFMQQIFGTMILPGFDTYWEEKNDSYSVMDCRLLYELSDRSILTLTAKNILNKEYLIRPIFRTGINYKLAG